MITIIIYFEIILLHTKKYLLIYFYKVKMNLSVCSTDKWTSYDTAIQRLKCKKQDEYYGMDVLASEEQCDPPIFACKFAQKSSYEHILALANEDGQIAIHNTENQERYSTNAHFNAVFDLAWMFGQLKLVSVSGDHTARLFDVGKGEILQEKIFHGHTRSVKTVAFRREDPAVFATGSRDGAIFIWDTRAVISNNYITQPDTIISHSHNIPNTPSSSSKFKKKFSNQNVSAANSVTSIVFQDDNTLISCGSGDGNIKVWDLRKNYTIHKGAPTPKYTLPHVGSTTRNGFSNLLIDQTGVRLYANCMDNNIYCYNIGTYNPVPVMTYTGHQNSTFYIKSCLSADGYYLVSGSSDQNAYIWNLNKSTPLVSLTGHTAEVTCVAWCQRGNLKLVTCSDDLRHKIWKIHDEDFSDDAPLKEKGSAVLLNDKKDTKILNTPSSRKRVINTTPHSQRKRLKICADCQMLTPGTRTLNCQNCIISYRGKRTSSQAGLSPGNENKRQNIDNTPTQKSPQSPNGQKSFDIPRTPRRLFTTLEPGTSRDELATIIEEKSPETFTQIANLPNFVIDGEAPHLNFSPKKKTDKDWLTKIRIEQSLRNQLEELSRPSSPKQPKLDSSYVSPKASTSKKNKRTGNVSKAQSPLLRFFRVTNNTSRSCEHQCSPLSSHSSNNELRQIN